jgi:hypothetical protein
MSRTRARAALPSVIGGPVPDFTLWINLMRWTTPDGIDVPARAVKCNELKESSIMEITTVGLDIAKRVFQLHGVDAAGKAVLRRKLQRSEVLAFFNPTALFDWH